MKIILEDLIDAEQNYDLIKNYKLPTSAMILPDRNIIFYNPNRIIDEEDWHITLVHEWLHDVFPIDRGE